MDKEDRQSGETGKGGTERRGTERGQTERIDRERRDREERQKEEDQREEEQREEEQREETEGRIRGQTARGGQREDREKTAHNLLTAAVPSFYTIYRHMLHQNVQLLLLLLTFK